MDGKIVKKQYRVTAIQYGYAYEHTNGEVSHMTQARIQIQSETVKRYLRAVVPCIKFCHRAIPRMVPIR